MNFSQLHEHLRREIWRRIRRGVLTSKVLANQTQLRPSHISNFLHRKRRLSLIALDRILYAQQITVQELTGSVPDRPPRQGSREGVAVPLVSQTVAINSPAILPKFTQGQVTLPAGFLERLPRRSSTSRRSWQRFVAVRVTAEQASPMAPRLHEGSIVIIDRQYNSLDSVRPPLPNLYALSLNDTMAFRYLSFDANRIILRPQGLDYPVGMLELPPYSSAYDLIIGRICVLIASA